MSVREIWETTHGVVMYPPTAAKPYYRLVYRDRNGKRHPRSAGRDKDQAWNKALEIDRELELSVTAQSGRTMGQLRDAFLTDMAPDWSLRHARDTRDWLTAALIGLEPLPCWELTRDHVTNAVNRGSTAKMRDHYRAAVGKMLSWGFDEDYLTQPREALMKKPRKTAKAEKGRRHGESRLFIEPRLRPSAVDAGAVADSMLAEGGDAHGERAWLMVALAASTGVRQGELFDLRKSRLNFTTGELAVRTQVVWVKADPADPDAPHGPMQTAPKWGRVRTTVLPARTLWGDPLTDRLAAFVAGLGDDDLVFPAPRGGWQHPSNFARDLWTPAREATPSWHAEWVWHSFRHTFCSHLIASGAEVADVSLAAGHRDTATTMSMYVSATKGTAARLGRVLDA